ncbi:MAG: excinuclease ABC subunit UvrC [Acidobacteria bacterium]|nr:excinuclease ABC subunit UvrC [Acidobacteriota bacterium]
MPIRDLKAQIDRLPVQPGVYLFFNREAETIYVGKARALRDRVRSYLGAEGTSPRHDAMLADAEALETIVTDSVVEALALENHLIKQRSPKYNVLLRDDKNYPYLQLTTGEAFPRVLVARRVARDAHFYAGPFMPAKFARKTMSLTHKLFGMRSCNEVIDGLRGRPCLEFEIKRCSAPCVRELCSREVYGRAVQNTKLFLEGRNDELIATLTSQMVKAAETERFEQAAQLRDAIRTIQTLGDRQQKMATVALGDRDAFGLKLGPAGAVVEVFQMRHGRVIERVELVTEAAAETRVADAGVIGAAVQQFYESRTPPPEIHLPAAAEDADVLETWLSGKAGRRVRIMIPKRGEKRGLLELAARNAAMAYQARFNENAAAHYAALEILQATLELPGLPRRIDCFDISTIQGSETVAAMVVCEDGRMKRSDYRKFRIRSTGRRRRGPDAAAAPDDFAAMREVVLRRYRTIMERGGPFPDLVLIDGGKGQLTAAYEAFQELGLANLVATGIAKKEEWVFTRDRPDPIVFPAESPALLLIQRIRDEAHRFAVTFHRLARRHRDLRSELDVIPGIGPRRRRALLTRFGSLAGVRRATREELTAIVGRRTADTVLAYLTESGR